MRLRCYSNAILTALFASLLLGGPAAAAGNPAEDIGGRNWTAYGRTADEARYSPLQQISKANVSRLGLAWSMELPGVRAAATTPVQYEGVLYFAVDRALVYAVDVVSGKQLWRYDPQTYNSPQAKEPGAGIKQRQHWGTRGLAFWDDKVFVGTPDGRLVALNAKTGQPVWIQLTTEVADGRNITGAPRVFDGMVIIGHGGGDTSAIRGYVTAYDARTGKQRWRFYTVPGIPAKGFEDEAMARAAQTWSGEWWKYGGGGTVWNAITYDSELDRIYIGTGNGEPWNWHIRSPQGGDNLYLSSIVALDAKTGKYLWHYQSMPGEAWDYDASADITLATLTIGGKSYKTLMQAEKNGFFYVIDRDNGKLLSAEKFAKVTWAQRIDLNTGKPVLNPDIDVYYRKAAHVEWYPSPQGAHSWQPMSYSQSTGLVYIPTIEMMGAWSPGGTDPATWKYEPGKINNGMNGFNNWTGDIPVNAASSALLAWDPVTQRKVWEQKTPGAWNGGVLSTAGGLVFQGHGDGRLVAYAADTGERLWNFESHMGIVGSPITYSVNGRQYVTLVAGWGGTGAGYMGSLAAQMGWVSRVHNNRVVTFALDEKGQLPSGLPPRQVVQPVDDPKFDVNPATAKAGSYLYSQTCIACHGAGVVASGYGPDLRASAIPLSAEAFAHVVHDGALMSAGMPAYSEFGAAELEQLRQFIRQRAREDLASNKRTGLIE